MSAKQRVLWHDQFNLSALVDRASQLRNVPCSCDLPRRPISGSLNWVIFLTFEDGVEWVFRSPTTGDYELSLEHAGELLESEVATLKYLKLNSSISVPDVFDYSSTKLNPIGIPFILMSKAPGTQLGDFRWNSNPLAKGPLHSKLKDRPCLSQPQREKVMRQLGAIASQLLSLRFNKIGSLFEDCGSYHIGKCLSPAFIFHDRVILGDDVPRGPFRCDSDYYKAMLSAFLLQVQELHIQQNLFFAPIPQPSEFKTSSSGIYATRRWNDLVTVGGKIDSTKNRLDYCTVGHFLQKMIPSISGDAFALLLGPEDGFPLCHHDLSAGNIFVDGDFNITCIIDWAFASTVPISTLLITPGLPNPRDDTDSILDSAFRSGFVDHHFDGKDAQLPPQLWEHMHRARLFTRLTIFDGLQDYRYFKELYTSIYQPPTDEELNISQLFKTVQKEDDLLVELSRTLREDERSVLEVSGEEEEYFAVIGGLEDKFEEDHVFKLEGIERHAIARKITLASELSRDFVADARLWRWIEEAIGERPTVGDGNNSSAKANGE